MKTTGRVRRDELWRDDAPRVAHSRRLRLDLDAPRYYGTLDDISPDERRPLLPPPEIVAHLEEAREILAAAGVDSELTSAAGEPCHEILEVARRVPTKTIVLGEHHHGFLAKLFGGDVAAGVQREARLHL